MTETYTNPKSDRRSLTHTGVELGADNVTVSQNATGREDSVISWECPRKYARITYAAGQHITKFTPRTRETHAGDGVQTTFPLASEIAAPNGETNLNEMAYQPVVAYDTDAGAQLEVESYNFNQNEVTFANAPNDGVGAENVVTWSVLIEGEVKMIGHDQFDNRVAALDGWGIPLHVFNDFDQDKNMTQIHLTGAITWEESERLVLYIDSPHQITWADADYPEGEFASTIEQRVDVDV